ncbi:MAG TPA: AAA family ATPase [Mycobacterium sp.]|uniref:AAA family ATPase n=1 Tax=Mycobacterium sp. TaxID=1785 RepID=UPI002F3E7278
MPSAWVAAPQDALLREVAAALDDPQVSGAAILGADGAGKTSLAHSAAEAFAAPSTSVHRVVGTATERVIPFGAFRALLADADITETGRPAELLRAAHDYLTGGDVQRLFVVDDAHHLDHLSATLVYQLALSGSARLIVTVASGVGLPDAIAALWADELLTRIEVEPLDATAIEALLQTPDNELAARSKGNPLALRLLIQAGGAPGDATLPALVDGYLSGLPSPVRTVLDYLSVAEPLHRGDVTALAGEDAVEQAEAAGAVAVDGDAMVYAAHPLYTGRAGATLAPDAARALRTSLAEHFAARPPTHIGDRLRLAALAVESDDPGAVDDLVAAAQHALRFGELALAERLAHAALGRSGGLAARLALGYALAWQGRGREADEVLAAVDSEQLSQPELMEWAMPRAANQFWMLSEPERATAFLQTTRNRISAPTAQATVDALTATFAMNAGTPLRTLRIAGEVLASPHAGEVAVGWAASAAALSSARTGQFDDVEALARRATAADHPGLLRFTSGFGRITALMMAGRVTEARALAERHTDFAELQQPGRAIGETLVGYVAIGQGDFDTAVRLLSRAADPLARTGYSWGPLSLMLLAQALGQQGNQLEAAKALSRAESRHGLKSSLFAPELALAKAWSKAARRDATGAIEAAREAVQAAERGGQSAIALRALHDAVRLGDVRAVQRAQRLAVEVNCVLGRLTLAHARALTDGDAGALAEVAADLADRGMHSAAADASAQAQRA